MTPDQLAKALPRSALALRGYNVTNLGRTRELLAHPAYGAVVARNLCELAAAAAEVLGRPVDLVRHVEANQEFTLETYGEAVTLILAMEVAQLELLHQHFGLDYRGAAFSFGYSLGEIGALIA
ncbi:MAG: hypothetical protein SFU86_14075, partial [Pirellulaceae bacterium]|nr:hypothetical protein [Pirellulaceae bacterium]